MASRQQLIGEVIQRAYQHTKMQGEPSGRIAGANLPKEITVKLKVIEVPRQSMAAACSWLSQVALESLKMPGSKHVSVKIFTNRPLGFVSVGFGYMRLITLTHHSGSKMRKAEVIASSVFFLIYFLSHFTCILYPFPTLPTFCGPYACI